MHVPGLPVQSVRFEGDNDDVEAGTSSSIYKNGQASGSGSVTAGNGDGSGAKPDSPPALRSKRHFYETLLERGLSIGISPSSPGFNLRQTFEEDVDPSDSDVSPLGLYLPRRTLSETAVNRYIDVEAVLDPEEDDESGQEERASSAWTRVIPAVEYQALSDRLNKLRQDTRGWFGGLFSKVD